MRLGLGLHAARNGRNGRIICRQWDGVFFWISSVCTLMLDVAYVYIDVERCSSLSLLSSAGLMPHFHTTHCLAVCCFCLLLNHRFVGCHTCRDTQQCSIISTLLRRCCIFTRSPLCNRNTIKQLFPLHCSMSVHLHHICRRL